MAVSLRPGREYVYQYEAQVMTGMPDTTTDFSGLTVYSNVTLQVQTNMVVKMKVSTYGYGYDHVHRLGQFRSGWDKCGTAC